MPIRTISDHGNQAFGIACDECGWASGPYALTVNGFSEAHMALAGHPCGTTAHRDLIRLLVAERFGRPR